MKQKQLSAKNPVAAHLLLLVGAWACMQVFLQRFVGSSPLMTNVDWWLKIGDLMSEKGFFNVWTPYPPIFPTVFYGLYNLVGSGGMHLAWQAANAVLLLGQAVLVYLLVRRTAEKPHVPVVAALGFLLVMIQPFSAVLLGLQMDQFDYLPTLLLLGSLYLLLEKRHKSSAILCGLGIMTKLFPAVLIPVAFAKFGFRRGLQYAGIAIAVCIVVAAPFLIRNSDAFASTWCWSAARVPWESAWAYAFPGYGTRAIIPNLPETPQRPEDIRGLFGKPYGGPAVGSEKEEIRNNPAAVNAITGMLTLAGAALVIFLLVRLSRETGVTDAHAVTGTLLLLVVLLAFSKGFSSYFVVWLAPLLCVVYPGIWGFALCGALIVLGNTEVIGLLAAHSTVAVVQARAVGDQTAVQSLTHQLDYFTQLGRPYLLFWRSILFREFILLAIAGYLTARLWKSQEVTND